MRTSILALSLLLLVSTQAHAGFWDFLFGSDDKDKTEQQLPPGEQLLKDLGSQLGVTKAQAQGGMGALLQLVQSNLKPEQFAQLNQSMPELQGLLKAAPQITEGSNAEAINGLLSKLGGLGEGAAQLNTLKAQFDALGLDTKMIAQYGQIALDYYKSQGGDTAQLIEQGLGALQQLIN